MKYMDSTKLIIFVIAMSPVSFAQTCNIVTQTNILSSNPEPLQIYMDTNYLTQNNLWIGDTESPIYTYVTTEVSPNQLLRRVFKAYDTSGSKVAEITELVQLYNCKVLNAATVRTPQNIYYDIKPLKNSYEVTYVIPDLSNSGLASVTHNNTDEPEAPPQDTNQDTPSTLVEDEPETPNNDSSPGLDW